MPSAVFVESPTVLEVGDIALAHGALDPRRLIVAPKRWIAAKHTAFHVCGEPLSAETVVAALLTELVSHAKAACAGEPPAGLVLTYPDSWPPRQVELLTAAAALIGYPANRIRTVTEAHAAANCYRQATPAAPGERIAVVDCGAATFDVTVLEATPEGLFHTLATRSDDALSGDNVDDAIRDWVNGQLAQRNPAMFARLERQPADSYALDSSIRLAKEQLSLNRTATIEVTVDIHRSSFVLTRRQLEDLIEDAADRAEQLVRDAIDDAGIGGPDQLRALYVLGGASRVPLVRRRLSAIGPVVIADALETVNARGALGAPSSSPLPGWLTGPQPVIHDTPRPRKTPKRKKTGSHALPEERRRRLTVGGAVTAAAVLAAGTAFLTLQDHAVAGIAVPIVSGTIHTGHQPAAIAIDPTTHTGYLANTDGTVTVVNLINKTVNGTVAVGQTPGAVAVDPVNHFAYVVNGGSSTGDSDPHGNDATVSVLDTTSNTVVATVPTGRNSAGIAVDPATHAAYVVNYSISDGGGATCDYCAQSSVTVIDGSSHNVTATMPIGEHARNIAIDGDTRTAYVANAGSDSVALVDTATNTRLKPVRDNKNVLMVRPTDVAVDPGTHSVYITSQHGTVVVNTDTNAVVTSIDTGPDSQAVAVDSGNHTAYVIAHGTLSEIDTATRTIRNSLPLGDATALAVDTATHTLYLTTGPTLLVLAPH